MLTLFLISIFDLLRFLRWSFQIFAIHFIIKFIEIFHFLYFEFIRINAYIFLPYAVKTLVKTLLPSSLFLCQFSLICVIYFFVFLRSKLFVLRSYLPIVFFEIMVIEIEILFAFFKLSFARRGF